MSLLLFCFFSSLICLTEPRSAQIWILGFCSQSWLRTGCFFWGGGAITSRAFCEFSCTYFWADMWILRALLGLCSRKHKKELLSQFASLHWPKTKMFKISNESHALELHFHVKATIKGSILHPYSDLYFSSWTLVKGGSHNLFLLLLLKLVLQCIHFLLVF